MELNNPQVRAMYKWLSSGHLVRMETRMALTLMVSLTCFIHGIIPVIALPHQTASYATEEVYTATICPYLVLTLIVVMLVHWSYSAQFTTAPDIHFITD